MDFVHHVLGLSKSDFIKLFLYECERTHFLINLSFQVYPKDMLKLGSESEIQEWIYKEQIEYLNSFPTPLTKEEYDIIQQQIVVAEE